MLNVRRLWKVPEVNEGLTGLRSKRAVLMKKPRAFRQLTKERIVRLAARRARFDAMTPKERKRFGMGRRPGGKRP